MKTLNVGSDFSGVGAFEEALNRLGIAHDTIFACDIDKYARETYLANHGKPNYFPHDVYEREIPKEPLDIYMTSPPCQAFSIAGKRKGEQDKRGVLFYNSHEFIIKNRPRYFIFENVKGLLSDDGGKTFQRWIDYLAKSVNGNPMIFPHEESAGYHVYYQILNSKDYGVPQNRERIFIVGVRDDCDATFLFPKTIPLTLRLKDMLEDNVDEKYFLKEGVVNKLLEYDKRNKEKGNGFGAKFHDTAKDLMSSLKVGGGGSDDLIQLNDPTHSNDRVYSDQGCSPTLNTMQGGRRQPFVATSDDTDDPKAKVCNQAVINPPTLIAGDGCTTQSSANFVVQLNPSTEVDESQLNENIEIKNLSGIGELKFLGSLKKHNRGDGSHSRDYSKQDRIYDSEGIAETIPSQDWTMGNYHVSETGEKNMHKILDNDDKDLNDNQQTKLDKLTVNDENQQITGSIRRLTPRECFRLQDFPDTFVLPCSDTQSYKQAGNSITVGVLAAIISKISFRENLNKI